MNDDLHLFLKVDGGWLKRMPTAEIGTRKPSAREVPWTVHSLSVDLLLCLGTQNSPDGAFLTLPMGN